MKITVITPNYNGAQYLETCMQSVLSQAGTDLEIEYIIIDGASTDGSVDRIRKYSSRIAHFVSEKDSGPANAINKGLKLATGEVVAWLNADDYYYPGALARVADAMARHPGKAICFGHCPIVGENGEEIRHGITAFKEAFFPFSCRFMIQCINYISQPATFFRRAAMEKAGGLLREDFIAAWDYDFWLRLWRQGGAVRVGRPPLAAFRWHEKSISGRHYRKQFKEEWEVTVADAGKYSLQALVHLCVRWGIVWSYALMERLRRGDSGKFEQL